MGLVDADGIYFRRVEAASKAIGEAVGGSPEYAPETIPGIVTDRKAPEHIVRIREFVIDSRCV